VPHTRVRIASRINARVGIGYAFMDQKARTL